MGCGCKKVQEKQDRIIDLNDRIERSQNRVERASLMAQRTITETNVEIGRNRVVKFFKSLFNLILFQIPFYVIIFTLVITFMMVYFLISLVAKTLFNKEIGGIMSPFAIYNNLKNNFVSESIKNMKEKIEKRRNESE